MNKIDKFLIKLSLKERLIASTCLDLVKSRKFENLNFKKLKRFDNRYRVRQGRIRIVFSIDNGKIEIIKVDRRNDNTYEDI